MLRHETYFYSTQTHLNSYYIILNYSHIILNYNIVSKISTPKFDLQLSTEMVSIVITSFQVWVLGLRLPCQWVFLSEKYNFL